MPANILPASISRLTRHDYVLRLPLVALFGYVAASKLIGWVEVARDPTASWLTLATISASLLFATTMFVLTVFRWKPLRAGGGLGNAFKAGAGSFLPLLMVAMPPAHLPPAVEALAIVMILAGSLLSFWTITHLGRSFSIMPQARQLVTTGPYAVVRHPLYLCEEIAVIGAMLSCLSPTALLLAAVHWVFQTRRAAAEEQLLRETFPEYAAYAARVPRYWPGLRKPLVAAAEIAP
jgi:protein-S-isoprenylcysteine O-methyltransferase Ste14